MLLTIVINTGQNSMSFISFLEIDVEKSLSDRSEKSAIQLTRVFDLLRKSIYSSMQEIIPSGNKKRQAIMDNLIRSSEGSVVSFQVFRFNRASKKTTLSNSSFTKEISDSRFENKNPMKIKDAISSHNISWINGLKLDETNSNKVLIKNISPYKGIGIGLFSMAVVFPLANSQDLVIGTLTVWQSEIINNLTNTKYEKGFVVDKKGFLLSSPIMSEIRSNRSFRSSAIFKTASKRNLTKGSRKNYYNLNRKKVFGSFAKIPNYEEYFVIYEQSASVIQNQITQTVIESLAWSVFLILLALGAGYYSSEEITKSLLQLTYVTQKIASGDFKVRMDKLSKDEVGILGHSINKMASQIQKLLSSEVEKVRYEQELETARIVQSTFFPKTDISTQYMKASGFYQPATECGGDLWGHYSIEENIELIFIADAMGHGAPAALVTATAYSTCMTMADLMRNDKYREYSPSELLERMNRVIFSAVGGKISMTCFAAVLDLNKGTLTYSNAGHNFPILLPNAVHDDRARKVRKAYKKITDIPPIDLALKGIPLGIKDNVSYKNKTMDVRAGDKIFLFTDGLIECESPLGEVWSRKYLTESILKKVDSSYSELKDFITKKAFSFFNGNPLLDDITVVVAEIDKDWSISEVASKDSVEPPSLNLSTSDELDINKDLTPDIDLEAPKKEKPKLAPFGILSSTPSKDKESSIELEDFVSQTSQDFTEESINEISLLSNIDDILAKSGDTSEEGDEKIESIFAEDEPEKAS